MKRRPVSNKGDAAGECAHPAVYNTLCVTCGKTVLTVADGAASPRAAGRSSSATSRIPAEQVVQATQALTFSNGLQVSLPPSLPSSASHHPRPTHPNPNSSTQLHLSKEEALRVQKSKISGLRGQRKLALVLDLDHTLLHASPSNGPPSASEVCFVQAYLPIKRQHQQHISQHQSEYSLHSQQK